MRAEWRGLTLPGWPLTQRRVSPQEQERHTGGALRRWSQSRGQGDAAQAQNPGARVGGWHRDPQSLQRDPLTGSPDVRLAAEQWETTLLSFKPARLKGCAVLTQEEQSIQSVLRRAAAPRQEPAKHQSLRVASRPALGQNAVLGCNLKNDRMISLHFHQEHWSGLPFPSPMQESEK